MGDTFAQYINRIEGITNSSYAWFETTTTDIKKLEKTVLSDLEKVMVFFDSIIDIEAFLKIVNSDDLLKYHLIKCRYSDVENFLAYEKKKFGSEDRWKGMRENLKNDL